jgi:AraC-like DNA-binding protein/quercetin dioxygenase-like cupin family protein
MSPTRHRVPVAPTELGTVVTSWDLGASERFPQHAHATHQLSVASRSAVALAVGDRTWVVPRSRALWLPAGVPHSVEAIGVAEMITLWFDPARCPIRWTEPTTVAVDDLLAALVARLADPDLPAPERSRTERVAFDLLRPLPVDELGLALPRDDRARAVGEGLLLEPADDRTLAEWGHEVGASERTLTRCFSEQTGLSFQEWRTRARITAALRLLLAGEPVARVAMTVGYATPSAFCAAFRRTMGRSPGSYRRVG